MMWISFALVIVTEEKWGTRETKLFSSFSSSVKTRSVCWAWWGTKSCVFLDSRISCPSQWEFAFKCLLAMGRWASTIFTCVLHKPHTNNPLQKPLKFSSLALTIPKSWYTQNHIQLTLKYLSPQGYYNTYTHAYFKYGLKIV